ncbi:MAG: LysE family translocator [Rhodobacteraceae bacterium]|nr:MAG: LysE family translocator [Paracoccaceae bacterium]
MLPDFVLPLAAFAFVTSVTPGPNNLMLMASGANFGFARTIPHMLGVALGFVFLASVVGLGLAGLFERWPRIYDVMLAVSVGYLLWLAWRIANAGQVKEKGAARRPLTFLEAAAFQWVNPKAWAMALTAVTVYAPGPGFAAVAAVALIFGAINLPSVGSWCLLGVQLRAFLSNPRRLKVFNWTMATLLIVSMVPMVI